MGDHYYTQKPSVSSEKKRIAETALGIKLDFFVDRGVFSKGGMDFGTRLLLESFELPPVEGLVCDAGCGWGAIGLTLASKYPDRNFILVDINERAVELAKENARMNRIENAEIFQNDLLKDVSDQFATVVTNPPIRAGKEVIFTLYEQAEKVLLPGGEIWIVIQKKQGAPSTQKKLEQLGFVVETVNKDKGYFIFRGKKS